MDTPKRYSEMVTCFRVINFNNAIAVRYMFDFVIDDYGIKRLRSANIINYRLNIGVLDVVFWSRDKLRRQRVIPNNQNGYTENVGVTVERDRF